EKSVLNRNYNPLPIDLMFGYSGYLTDFLLYHLNYLKFLHSYLNKYSPTLTSLYNTSVLVFFLSSCQINIKFCVHNQSGLNKYNSLYITNYMIFSFLNLVKFFHITRYVIDLLIIYNDM